MQSGDGLTAAGSGDAFLRTGDSGSEGGPSGSIEIQTGSSNSGGSGDIKLLSGNTTLGSSGSIIAEAGTSDFGAGGGISLVAGNTSSPMSNGGEVLIKSGSASNINQARGGGIEIRSGDGRSGPGGDISITVG